MNGLLLDTHAWLWYLIGSSRLSLAAREAIANPNLECWLSPLSIWELTVLVRKKRFEVEGNVRGFIDRSLQVFPVRIATIDFDIAEQADALDLPHRDPVDRFIAASALRHGLQLITADQNLRQAAWLPTLW